MGRALANVRTDPFLFNQPEEGEGEEQQQEEESWQPDSAWEDWEAGWEDWEEPALPGGVPRLRFCAVWLSIVLLLGRRSRRVWHWVGALGLEAPPRLLHALPGVLAPGAPLTPAPARLFAAGKPTSMVALVLPSLATPAKLTRFLRGRRPQTDLLALGEQELVQHVADEVVEAVKGLLPMELSHLWLFTPQQASSRSRRRTCVWGPLNSPAFTSHSDFFCHPLGPLHRLASNLTICEHHPVGGTDDFTPHCARTLLALKAPWERSVTSPLYRDPMLQPGVRLLMQDVWPASELGTVGEVLASFEPQLFSRIGVPAPGSMLRGGAKAPGSMLRSGAAAPGSARDAGAAGPGSAQGSGAAAGSVQGSGAAAGSAQGTGAAAPGSAQAARQGRAAQQRAALRERQQQRQLAREKQKQQQPVLEQQQQQPLREQQQQPLREQKQPVRQAERGQAAVAAAREAARVKQVGWAGSRFGIGKSLEKCACACTLRREGRAGARSVPCCLSLLRAATNTLQPSWQPCRVPAGAQAAAGPAAAAGGAGSQRGGCSRAANGGAHDGRPGG